MSQRLLIHVRYAVKLVRSLLPSLVASTVVFTLGTIIVHLEYGVDGTPLHEAVMYMYFLMLAEPTFPDTPDNLLVEAVIYIAPLVGIIIVFDMLARFSLHVFSAKTNQREYVNVVASTYRNHIVLIGLGRVGRKVFQELVDLGEQVVCIDQSEEAAGVRLVRSTDHPVIIDDARIDQVLLQARIDQARAVLAVTDDDMVNLEIALDARKFNANIRIIARIFDEKLGRKITQGLNIDGVYSTSSLAAPFFAVTGLDPDIVNSFVVNEERFVVVETDVEDGDWLAGATVCEALDEHGLAVMSTVRAGRALDVRSDLSLLSGDRVCFQCRYDHYREWRARGGGG